MVSFVPHLVIPGLVALAFFAIPKRTSLMWSWVAWVPDLDYLIQSEHRAITHSLFVPMAFFAAVVVLWRRRDPEARFWEFATRPGAPVVLSLASYYWASHLLLDVFAGGVVLLWPLVNYNVYMDFEILLNTKSNTFHPGGEAGTSQGAPQVTPLYDWLSAEHTAYLAFFAACLLVAAGVWAWRRWRN